MKVAKNEIPEVAMEKKCLMTSNLNKQGEIELTHTRTMLTAKYVGAIYIDHPAVRSPLH